MQNEIELIKSKGSFKIKFPNGKVRRFKTQETYSDAWAVIFRGRYTDVGKMYEAILKLPTGF